MFQFIPKEQKKKIRNVTVLILYAIFAFWFLINGEGLFPDWDSSWTYSTLIYLIGVSIFLSIQEKLPSDFDPDNKKSNLANNIIGFCFTFPIVILILIAIRDSGIYFQYLQNMPKHLIPATLVYQLVIVATSEEIIFRGVIFRFLYQYHWVIAWIGSSLIFSIFHFAVSQGNLSNLALIFIIGIVLAWLVDRFNLGVTIAVHWVWNIFVLGAIVTFI